MKTRTEIKIEYAPCRRTPSGKWRPITIARYYSKIEAERRIEDARKLPGAGAAEDYKVMQRTVVVTLSEWEDVRHQHEGIVDQATWEAAQKKMKENQPPAPWGYKYQDGKLVIDEEEAKKFRAAIDEFLED